MCSKTGQDLRRKTSSDQNQLLARSILTPTLAGCQQDQAGGVLPSLRTPLQSQSVPTTLLHMEKSTKFQTLWGSEDHFSHAAIHSENSVPRRVS